MDNKLGICLTGGGARGAYQIGALKALEELGILQNAKVFSGTSIGSVNASITTSRSIDDAVRLWLNPNRELLKLKKEPFKLIKDQLFSITDVGMYENSQLEQLISNEVDYNNLNSTPVYVTVAKGGKENGGIVELAKTAYKHYVKKDSKVLYMPLDKIDRDLARKSIIASCSIPFIFKPVNYNEENYFDGGMYDNIPLKPLIDEGCNEIIIIHLNKTLFFNTKKYKNITIHEIKNKKSLGNVLDFNSEHSKKIFMWGYEDTKKYFLNLEKNKTKVK